MIPFVRFVTLLWILLSTLFGIALGFRGYGVSWLDLIDGMSFYTVLQFMNRLMIAYHMILDILHPFIGATMEYSFSY